jgi:hypothetical protein
MFKEVEEIGKIPASVQCLGSTRFERELIAQAFADFKRC